MFIVADLASLIVPTNVDLKSLETEFSIVICRQTDPHSSIVKIVFDCRLYAVNMTLHFLNDVDAVE